MPPQAYLVLGGLAWNYQRSRVGKPTISMFCRRHPAAFAVAASAVNAWIWPHIYRKESW
jgi:hypothetical protein